MTDDDRVRLVNTQRLDQWLSSINERATEALMLIAFRGRLGADDIEVIVPETIDAKLLVKVFARAVVKLRAGEYTHE